MTSARTDFSLDRHRLREEIAGQRIMPTSGCADELLAVAGIDRNAIAQAVREMSRAEDVRR
jgi:hypothetical protein